MDDSAIVELFFSRSERAIGELDAKYGALCRGLALNIVGDGRDAEECVADAYLGAWNAIPPERPDPLRAYILKIVRNLALKSLRRMGAAKRTAVEVALDELEPCIPGGGSPEDAVEARELALEIERFLDTQSAESRVIFIRRYWFSESLGSIAQRTGLTEKAVSARLTRMRGKLRNYLAERGVYV